MRGLKASPPQKAEGLPLQWGENQLHLRWNWLEGVCT